MNAVRLYMQDHLLVELSINLYISRRPRWLGRLSSCPLKSISRVHVSPSAHTGRDFFLHKKLISGKRESVSNILENRRAVGMLNSMRDKNWRHVAGGRRDDTYLWPRLVVQKIAEGKNTSYELSWKKVKEVMIKKQTNKLTSRYPLSPLLLRTRYFLEEEE